MTMYEAKQNKEKVSRKIDASGRAEQKIKIGNKGSIIQFVFPFIHGYNNPNYQANTAFHFCECVVQAPTTTGNNAWGNLPSNCNNMDRGHLIPKRFGGTGNNSNWLPIYHQTNNGPMKKNENEVYKAITAGETVYYRVQGIFEIGKNYPTWICTTALNYFTGQSIPIQSPIIINGEY